MKTDTMATAGRDPRRGVDRQEEIAAQFLPGDSKPPMTGQLPAESVPTSIESEQTTIPPNWKPLAQQPAWRKDFPIDWPRDHYIARRDFAKYMVLTSLAFFVGQVWIGIQNLLRRERGSLPARKIASLSALSPGSFRQFFYPGENDPCLLLRASDGTLLAFSQLCTHLSCAVVPRMKEGTLFCPCHDGLFDLASGRPIAGPPRRPLPRITLEVRGDDIYATGVQWRTT